MPPTTIDLRSKHLLATSDDGILTVRFARPERKNAMTVEMYHGVKRACRLAEEDAAIDVVVLTGTGDVFCVGGEMSGRHEGQSHFDAFTDMLDVTPFVQIERCPKLVLTRINGMCQGGGLVMTLMSDLSIAVESAKFRVPELLRGVADPWVMGRLATRVGMAQAKRLAFTGRYFSAREALDMGLIGEVVHDDELDAAVAKTIEEVRMTGPRARTLAKRDFNQQLPTLHMEMFQETVGSPECIEAWVAFTEKRTPKWPR
ncbi:MAG: enoyl-CoA hydratase/isomerase family protein [Gemmatimonadota bacterium]